LGRHWHSGRSRETEGLRRESSSGRNQHRRIHESSEHLDDGPSDIFGTILGESFNHDVVVRDMGGEYRIQQNYFKFFACCRINHPSLQAVMDVRNRESFAPEDVQAVDIVAPSMLEGMLGEYPSNMLGAKFNVPYAVAAAIVRDSANVNSFYSDARGDERIRELAAKVQVTTDPKLATAREDGPLTQAFVRLKDGRVLESGTTIVRGDYGNRLPREELLEKFHFLNDSILGSERANEVIATTDGLERLSDVRDLTALVGG